MLNTSCLSLQKYLHTGNTVVFPNRGVGVGVEAGAEWSNAPQRSGTALFHQKVIFIIDLLVIPTGKLTNLSCS